MNSMHKMRFFVVAVLMASSLALADGEYDWVKDYIVVKESENVRVDGDGNPVAVNITKRSSVTISQTYRENKKKNKKGVLVTVSKSRETVVEDTNEYVSTIKETDFLNGEGMQVVSVTINRKTPNGRMTTVESRNKEGDLVMTRRVVTTTDQDGVTKTTVETPDKNGNLVVRQTTFSQ